MVPTHSQSLITRSRIAPNRLTHLKVWDRQDSKQRNNKVVGLYSSRRGIDAVVLEGECDSGLVRVESHRVQEIDSGHRRLCLCGHHRNQWTCNNGIQARGGVNNAPAAPIHGSDAVS